MKNEITLGDTDFKDLKATLIKSVTLVLTMDEYLIAARRAVQRQS